MKKDLEIQGLNQVEDRTGDYWTALPNAILYNSVHLSMGSRLVYMFIKSFTNQHSKVAFPSQSYAIQILGCTKMTYIKYIKELEDVNLLEVQRSRKAGSKYQDVNRYVLLPIPEEIKKGASICMTQDNAEEIENAKSEFKVKNGETEHGNKGKKKTIKDVLETDKLKVLAELSKYEKKANMDVIDAIISANKFKEVEAIAFKKKKAPLRIDTYLSLITRYIAIYGNYPETEEIDRLIELNKKYSKKALLGALLSKRSVFLEEFEADVSKRNDAVQAVGKRIAGIETKTADFKKKDSFVQQPLMSEFDKDDFARFM